MSKENLNFREFVEAGRVEDWHVVSLYHQHPHMPVREIAARTRRSIGEVYRTLERAGGFKNRQHPDHNTVHSYAAAGLRPPEIADRTNYSRRHVSRILKGG